MDLRTRCAELVEAKGRLSEAERLKALLDLNWEWVMTEYPEAATRVGYPGQNHRWTDASLEAIARRNQAREEQLDVVESIDPSPLPSGDRLNYDLFRKNLEEAVEGARYKSEYMPLGPMGGPHSTPAQIVAIMPTAAPEHFEDVVSRLRRIPELIEQSLALLGKGLETGITTPKVTLRDTAEQIRMQIVEDPLDSPILRPFKEFPPGFPAQDGERLREEAAAVYRDEVAPAFQRFHDYTAETYVPSCRESIACHDLPDGEDWYAYLVRRYTTTDLAAGEIHEIGLSEVKRIRVEMDEAIERSGFKGTFGEFIEFLRGDPQFFYDDPEELLRAYRDIGKRADPELAKLFGTLPRLPYGVVPVPSYIEKTATTAYYQPGSPEAGRAGYFYANTYDLKSRPRWEMEALTLHEAVPGHHLQIAIAQELEGWPEFRKHGGYTAFVEGWGLYAESLGGEMGFYQDPYSEFGRLTYEMWRAIRLVVDTGMHALRWSREQAIDFFTENLGKAQHDIVVEVDRYISWPGQALAYKIGELKLKELRAYAAAELGDAFDLRAFHDEVLGQGALPLDVLEDRIRAWVAGALE